jgi:hypothetical protein
LIVSHRHRFIFLKTEKTGSTSVEIALSRLCGDSDVITPLPAEDERTRQRLGGRGPQNCKVPFDRYDGQDWLRLRQVRQPIMFYNHMPAAEVRRFVGEGVWAGHFSFCFERNPWDRAISLYYWETKQSAPRPSLREFLTAADPKRLSNYDIYALHGEVAVDHLGRYESLDSELSEISRRLGLPTPLPLPRTKATTRLDRRHYREVLGTLERRIVARACAHEIELLGYEF